MKKIVVLIVSLVISNMVYSQSIKIHRNELDNMYEANRENRQVVREAMNQLDYKLKQKQMLLTVQANEYLKLLKEEIPREYSAYRMELIQAVIEAKNEYLSDPALYYLSNSGVENYMYEAYQEKLKQITKSVTKSKQENLSIQNKGKKIIELKEMGKFSEELQMICDTLIPTFYKWQIKDIPYYCYDILLFMSLNGYVKNTNNLVKIKQSESRKSNGNNISFMPASYANINDFIQDYYELYVAKGKSVNEDSMESAELRKIVKNCYAAKINATLTALDYQNKIIRP